MSEFKFIDYSELSEIMKQAAQELILEEQYEVLPPLQQIKTICLLFKKFSSINSNTPDMQKEVYSLGTRLVFTLRSFLLQSEILFTIGAISPDGKQLSTSTYSQDEILNNLNINLKNSQVELSYALEKFDSEKLDTYSSLWPKILAAANVEWNNGNGIDEKRLYVTSKNKKKYIYSKKGIDTNVWVRYYMRRKQRVFAYYYDKGGFDLVAYNKGWLYEWFQEYVQNIDNAQELQAAFTNGSKTPLKGMMSGAERENIPGYKGGDYQLANGRWAQAKYGNKRIITFKSICSVVDNVLKFIEQYEKGANYSKEQLATDLTKTFTDVNTINDSYDKIVDTVLSSLNLTF